MKYKLFSFVLVCLVIAIVVVPIYQAQQRIPLCTIGWHWDFKLHKCIHDDYLHPNRHYIPPPARE